MIKQHFKTFFLHPYQWIIFPFVRSGVSSFRSSYPAGRSLINSLQWWPGTTHWDLFELDSSPLWLSSANRCPLMKTWPKQHLYQERFGSLCSARLQQFFQIFQFPLKLEGPSFLSYYPPSFGHCSPFFILSTIGPPDRFNSKIKVIFIFKLRFQCFDHIAVLTHYGEQMDNSRFRAGTDQTQSLMTFWSLINHWDGQQRSWFNGLLGFPILWHVLMYADTSLFKGDQKKYWRTYL